MLKKLKITLISAFALGVLAVPVFAAGSSSAQTPTTPQVQSSLCQGSKLQFGGGDTCTTGAQEGNLNSLIARIVNIISVIVGIVAVIMIIFGGFKYITSGGDSGNVSGAKNTILYAIIGLIIVALAQFIVRFVLGQSQGLVNTP